MRVIDTVEELRAVRQAIHEPIGLVPTMGALHEGHINLVRRAVKENTHVFATIFVNPTQFGPNEDFESYPRDLDNDLKWLKTEGVDVVFTPTPDLMYPPGYQTYVETGSISERLEGAKRPGHFRGVTTIVSKLFNLIQPTRAYFGQKDAQQVAVIRRMVHDLNFPIEIIPCPIVREPDGLAMSSRNRYLSLEQRSAAIVLYKALKTAGKLYANGERNPEVLRQSVHAIVTSEPLAELDYVSLSDASSLEELSASIESPALLSLTVRFGSTRLLDNTLLPFELNSEENLIKTLGKPQ